MADRESDLVLRDTQLPDVLSNVDGPAFHCDSRERYLLRQAASLLKDQYPGHALLDLWNAAVRNVRRRVEAFGVQHFELVVKEQAGRKALKADGDTLAERWENVDDFVLIGGARALSIVDGKAWKCLETINWMRNHASPSHDTEERGVTAEDVRSFAALLAENLFRLPLPEPGHSVASLFGPVQGAALDLDQIAALKDQLASLPGSKLRTAFGFLLEQIVDGDEDARENARLLFPDAWGRATPDLKQMAGQRYYKLWFERTQDGSDRHLRLLNMLVQVEGVSTIPEAARTQLYREAAKRLAAAKDSSYGWKKEAVAAQQLAQFGVHVPNTVFVELYQEILCVWCGNHWGRSGAHVLLEPFLTSLENRDIRQVLYMFKANSRVREELGGTKPKKHALDLIDKLSERLTLEMHLADADEAKEEVERIM